MIGRWFPRRRSGVACYAADLRVFGRNLDATAALVRKLRNSKQAVLRTITLPNVIPGAEDVVPSFITPEIGVYQNKTLKQYICSAMAKHRRALRRRLPGVQWSRRNAERVRERFAHRVSMLLPEWEGPAGHG
jgi:hypothetical protein